MDLTLDRTTPRKTTQLIDPKNDFAFKRIFGSSEHPNTLLDFLNAILEANNEPILSSVTVLNPHLDPKILGDKSAVLDIRARGNRGEVINIEMQFVNPYHWHQRILYYWSKLYHEQLKQGDDYKELRKTLSFSILNFELLPGSHAHALYELRNRYDNDVLCDQLQLYFVELPKVSPGLSPMHLDNWCRFLQLRNVEDLKQLTNKNPAINEACAMLSQMSQNPSERELYEMRQKSMMDYSSNMKGAKLEGKSEGKAEGKVELLIDMATAQFGPLPDYATQNIQQASAERLQQLSLSLLKAKDVESWLDM